MMGKSGSIVDTLERGIIIYRGFPMLPLHLPDELIVDFEGAFAGVHEAKSDPAVALTILSTGANLGPSHTWVRMVSALVRLE